MAERTYGQYCGLAHAATIVGERWALLILRDLTTGPKRYGDLAEGLPRIPSSVLATRLKELEAAGVIERAPLPAPTRGFAYRLTAYGQELDPILLALGRWGAQTMGDPKPGDVVTPSSVISALRTTFRPGDHEPATTVIRMPGFALTARTGPDGSSGTPGEPAAGDPTPDLVLTLDGTQLKALLDGSLSPREAVRRGLASDRAALERFLAAYRI